jgi:hypothetical protein
MKKNKLKKKYIVVGKNVTKKKKNIRITMKTKYMF